jgi:hypothetical protein
MATTKTVVVPVRYPRVEAEQVGRVIGDGQEACVDRHLAEAAHVD